MVGRPPTGRLVPVGEIGDPWVAVATHQDDAGHQWVEIDVYIGGQVFEMRADYPFGGPEHGVKVAVVRAGPKRVELCSEAVSP